MSSAEPFMPAHLPTSRDTEAAEIDLDHDVDILDPTGADGVDEAVPEYPENEVFRTPAPGDGLTEAELEDDLA
jgi:hypothetical protein